MYSVYKNIISAVDGSENSKKSFFKAIEVAKSNEAKLILISIIDTSKNAAGVRYGVNVVEEEKKDITKKLNNFIEEARNQFDFTNIEVLIQQGYPKSIIVDSIIPQYKTDLIVVGASGYNSFQRFMIGSISEHISRYAPCDVLIVR